jgi:hypothetical protein
LEDVPHATHGVDRLLNVGEWNLLTGPTNSWIGLQSGPDQQCRRLPPGERLLNLAARSAKRQRLDGQHQAMMEAQKHGAQLASGLSSSLRGTAGSPVTGPAARESATLRLVASDSMRP